MKACLGSRAPACGFLGQRQGFIDSPDLAEASPEGGQARREVSAVCYGIGPGKLESAVGALKFRRALVAVATGANYVNSSTIEVKCTDAGLQIINIRFHESFPCVLILESGSSKG